MTYEDFLRQAQGSGLLEQFSQYDLDTAKLHPEFGATMLSYKQDYANAADAAAKQRINQQAEALRKQYGNYTGGSDGSRYYGIGPSPGSYQNPYQSEISKLLQGMSGYEDFTYGEAPTYENRYQQELDSLLGKVQNYGPFAWSKEDDPSWSAYAKQYRREGERASANALAQAAAASGGQISTAAMTAAGQAGDYYASQLSDKIPELYQNAYNRYLSEYSMLLDQLNATRQAEQYDYQAYLDQLGQYNTDREMSYDQWLQGYNMLGSTLGAYQGQDETEYQRLLDQVGYNSDQQQLARDQVDAMLAAGMRPGANLVGQSGYDTGYIDALDSYYKQQAAKGNGGSGNGENDEDADPEIGDSPAYDDVLKKVRSYEKPEEAEAYLNRMVDAGQITEEEAAYIYQVVLGLGGDIPGGSGNYVWYQTPESGSVNRTIESW